MWKVDEKTAAITTVQGDDGHLTVYGLPTDRDYFLYFSVYNEDRKAMFASEPYTKTNYLDTAELIIPAKMTDLLVVPNDEDTKTYYYGLKICYPEDGIEDTLVVGNGKIGDLNEIIVYPKKTEGTL